MSGEATLRAEWNGFFCLFFYNYTHHILKFYIVYLLPVQSQIHWLVLVIEASVKWEGSIYASV